MDVIIPSWAVALPLVFGTAGSLFAIFRFVKSERARIGWALALIAGIIVYDRVAKTFAIDDTAPVQVSETEVAV